MNSNADTRWNEARARMLKYVDAIFWQDLGIEAPEKDRYVDWILDRIFRDEYIAALQDDWTVWRQDDSGQHFEMKRGLGYYEAKEMVSEYEARGHKQFYWFSPTKHTDTNNLP